MWELADANKRRHGIQTAAALIQNANFKGFFTGRIYTGQLKSVCVPGLNCYSCPGALGACPIGSLQSFLSRKSVRFPYYVVGLLIFFGALLGRAVCGFLCPMGWIQELLAMIPFPVKQDDFPGDRALRRLKYVILAVFVVILPMHYVLIPFFCKYICPSGTLAGIALAAADSAVAGKLGSLFAGKLGVLLGIVLLSLIVWRPFCKYLCPLGAVYSLFNRFSLYRLQVDEGKCVGCGKCAATCRMRVDPAKNANSGECIRCGACVEACPTKAIEVTFAGKTLAPRKGD